MYIYIYIKKKIHLNIFLKLCQVETAVKRIYNLPVVPHKAVAEVSKIGNL